MKFLSLLSISILIFSNSFSQGKMPQKAHSQIKFAEKNYYPLVIKFQSVCCGVPSDAPLRTTILAFKKENNIKVINAKKISPMGKEGEYYLTFSMMEMNKAQKDFFKKEIYAIAPKLNDKGKVEVVENLTMTKADLPSLAKFSLVSF